jgi:hypothetical protein
VSGDPLTAYPQEIRSIPLLKDEKPATAVTLPLTDNGTAGHNKRLILP